ncbi:hypothetical protein GFH30_09340 [Acinetobacter wanghuae]|uniref:Uncharacterized protein n=1 Tax=Acinetobacter wanghuae TaxID=2662362 RepID=A0A5Q0P5B8_9GAMM|nr:hypothetical protein [Acinetobacter wanghuae]MQW91700.1 hypothetical protein [Acinetobacter wanghuae]QGA11580.1 hypothetical protein GFH30_09340 [Acinetobacter wanghuae]
MSSSFNLQQLQLRHPDAFFYTLGYSRYKYFNPATDIHLYLRLSLLMLLTTLMCFLISAPLYWHYFEHKEQAISAGSMILIAFIYPYLWRMQIQAKYSSFRYAKRLQRCLYLQLPLFLLCLLNFKYTQSAVLGMPCLVFITLSLATIWMEALFKNATPRIDLVRLQKIRQLAYWSYRQSRLKHPQAVAHQTHLKQYYLDLHHTCMQAEQSLLNQIRHSTIKDAFLDS